MRYSSSIKKLAKQINSLSEEQYQNLLNELNQVKVTSLHTVAKDGYKKQTEQYESLMKRVNNVIYSYDYTSRYLGEISARIFGADFLTERQKKHILFKEDHMGSVEYYLQKGYWYIWNLNNDMRSPGRFALTRYYIQSLKPSIRKLKLLKKLYFFSQRDSYLHQSYKESLQMYIFIEICKFDTDLSLGCTYEYNELKEKTKMFFLDRWEDYVWKVEKTL